MTLSAILGSALLVVLTRPTSWLLALAAFLVRGGIVWFLVPILILPTPIGLANAFGPTIVGFVFGGLTAGLIVLMLAGVAALVLWIVVGGLAAAAIEVELIVMVVEDDDVGAAAGPGARPTVADGRILRVLAVRLLALAPLLVGLVIGATRIVAVTYAELTLPGDLSTPIVWRVLGAVPDAVILLIVGRLVGEMIAALASRRVVLRDPSIARALLGAIGDVVRHPLRVSVLFGLPTLVLLLVLVPSAAAATVSWTGLRSALVDGSSPLAIALAIGLFLGLWGGAMVLTGAVCAWRQAVWTIATVPVPRGTFGGSATGRPGDWNTFESSGTL